MGMRIQTDVVAKSLSQLGRQGDVPLRNLPHFAKPTDGSGRCIVLHVSVDPTPKLGFGAASTQQVDVEHFAIMRVQSATPRPRLVLIMIFNRNALGTTKRAFVFAHWAPKNHAHRCEIVGKVGAVCAGILTEELLKKTFLVQVVLCQEGFELHHRIITWQHRPSNIGLPCRERPPRAVKLSIDGGAETLCGLQTHSDIVPFNLLQAEKVAITFASLAARPCG